LEFLERLQLEDSSLIPTYLSFLVGLAMAADKAFASNGATEVCRMLLDSSGEENGRGISWRTIVSTLRWYVRALSPLYTETQPKPMSSDFSPGGSTAYYYTFDDIGSGGPSRFPSSSADSSEAKREGETKLKELGEENAAILLSHLGLISKVACRHPAAREAFLSTKLPVTDGDGSAGQQDDLLLVLFSLSMAPLCPVVRGEVFATLSNLLGVDGCSTTEAGTVKEMALRIFWKRAKFSQHLFLTNIRTYSCVITSRMIGTVIRVEFKRRTSGKLWETIRVIPMWTQYKTYEALLPWKVDLEAIYNGNLLYFLN